MFRSLRSIFTLASVQTCVGLLLFSCFLPGADREWTVMSWNVQNLFDDVDHGTEYPEFDPGGPDWSSRLYHRRLERTADIVKSAVGGGPDLLVLQELENEAVLKALAEGPLKSMDYPWRLAVSGYGIIRCGVLSRYPLEKIHVVDSGLWASRSLRPAVSFMVRTPAGPVKVFAVHWKSPRDGRSATESARRREARIVGDLVYRSLQSDSLAEILIIGDLNTPGDGAVKPAALSPWDPHGSGNDDAILWRTDAEKAPALWKGRPVLYDPEPREGPPGTCFFGGKWVRPDRALLTPGLRDSPGLSFSYCRIFAPEVMLDLSGRPLRWSNHLEEGYSDHLPLVLGFTLPE